MADATTDTSTTDTTGQKTTDTTTGDDTSNEVDKWKAMSKKHEADAKANAAAAKKLAEIEEANKTEIEKAQGKVTAAEAEVAKVPSLVADALRGHLVALHKIPAEDAELFLTATDPELLLKQIDRLVGREGEKKKTGNFVRNEGNTNTQSKTDPNVEFLRELTGRT